MKVSSNIFNMKVSSNIGSVIEFKVSHLGKETSIHLDLANSIAYMKLPCDRCIRRVTRAINTYIKNPEMYFKDNYIYIKIKDYELTDSGRTLYNIVERRRLNSDFKATIGLLPIMAVVIVTILGISFMCIYTPDAPGCSGISTVIEESWLNVIFPVISVAAGFVVGRLLGEVMVV